MNPSKHLVAFVENARQNGYDLVSVSVLETSGSTYAKAGGRMLMNSQGESIGVLGGDALHHELLQQAQAQLLKRESARFEIDQRGADSTHGITSYQIEPFYADENYRGLEIGNPYRILLFGKDVRCTPILAIVDVMGWESTVIAPETDITAIDLSLYDAAIIISHNFEFDCAVLKAIAKSEINYIGLMGNRNEVKKKIEAVDPNLLSDPRIFAPIGIPISTHSHESIALSVCAQIEARKNGKI